MMCLKPRHAPPQKSPPTQNADANTPRLFQIHLYREYVDQRIRSAEDRLRQYKSSAGILIAATALTTTWVGTEAPSILAAVALILNLGAATCGVIVLTPKAGNYLDLTDTRTTLIRQPRAKSELALADNQSDIYTDRLLSIQRNGLLLQFGFSALALSALLSTIDVWI